jgi:hypothetical protein
MLMGLAKNVDPSNNATLETALMPVVNHLGSSDLFGIGENEFDLRIVFYRGQNIIGAAPNNKGGNYILANTTRFGLNGYLVGDLDLTLHLPTGIFKRWANNIFEKSANGLLGEQFFRLLPNDILNIGKRRKIIVDNVSYLLKNVSISVSKKFETCRAKLLKL